MKIKVIYSHGEYTLEKKFDEFCSTHEVGLTQSHVISDGDDILFVLFIYYEELDKERIMRGLLGRK